MSLAILGVITLGSLLFLVYTVVSYLEEASPLQARRDELAEATAGKTKKLEEYQRKIRVLEDAVPATERRIRRLEIWIEQLKAQRGRVEAANAGSLDLEMVQREAAIKAGVSTKWPGVG